MGAVATGATIWCTHFVAMIAYQPGVEVAYEPLLTGLSLGVAILGSAIALWIGARRPRASAMLGGGVFGLAVVSMHYLGMAAFAVEGVIHWSAAYVAASVVGAVLLGASAFEVTRRAGPPWASIIYSWDEPSRLRVTARLRPSGDQAGALLEPRKLASRRRRPDATSCT